MAVRSGGDVIRAEGSRLLKIAVPHEVIQAGATSPRPVLAAVRTFVAAAFDKGLFTRFDLPAEVMQAAWIQDYLSDVAANGHALYLRRTSADWDHVHPGIEMAFAEIGARSFLELFRKFRAVALKVRTAVPPGIESVLQDVRPLDQEFQTLTQTDEVQRLVVRWLSERGVLEALPSVELGALLDDLPKLNPLFQTRLVERRIAQLKPMLSERRLMGLGLAVARATPPSAIIKLGDGWPQLIGHGQDTGWEVTTTTGDWLGIVNDQGSALYEKHSFSPEAFVEMGLKSGMIRNPDFPRATLVVPPVAGKAVSHVSAAEITKAIAMCRTLQVGPAIALMLRGARIDDPLDFATVLSVGPKYIGLKSVTLMIMLGRGRRMLTVRVTSFIGGKLTEFPSGLDLAQASIGQINGAATMGL